MKVLLTTVLLLFGSISFAATSAVTVMNARTDTHVRFGVIDSANNKYWEMTLMPYSWSKSLPFKYVNENGGNIKIETWTDGGAPQRVTVNTTSSSCEIIITNTEVKQINC